MLRRSLTIVLIIALIMETGCAKRIPVDVYPIRRPSDRVQAEDKVSVVLREEMTLKGTSGIDSLSMEPIEWQTLEITGELVTWNEEQVTVRVIDWSPGENALFEIPLEQIEQIDEWPSFKPGPTLAAIGGLALILGVTVLIVILISKP
jgi:hypothetical protein